MGDPKFCWRRPISVQLLLGCPCSAGDTSLLLETPLLGAPFHCGDLSLLPAAPPFFLCFFFLLGRPSFVRSGAPFSFFWGTAPLLGLPFRCQGRPSCAEYAPLLLVMRRPSSTGGTRRLLPAGKPICCRGNYLLPDIVNGAPLSCLASQNSAGDSLFLVNFCCGASLLLGRPSSGGGAPLLLETLLFWAPSAAGGTPLLLVASIFFLWGSFFAGAPICCQGASLLLGMGAPLSVCWGVAPLQGCFLLLGVPFRCQGRPS